MRTRSTIRAVCAPVVEVGLVLLAACAGAPDGGSGGGDGKPAAEDGGTRYPLTFESDYGDTVLEERPERIAVVNYGTAELDAVLALGVDPVFASPYDAPWLDREDMERIEQPWDPSIGPERTLEAVRASDPDLIISMRSSSPIGQHTFADYAEIAPVLFAQAGSVPWDDLTLRIGEALDRSGTAEEIVSEGRERMAEARESQEYPMTSVAHVIVRDEEYGAGFQNVAGSGLSSLMQELEFIPPPGGGAFTAGSNRVLDDQIVLLEASVLLVSTIGEDDTAYFFESPRYLGLDAVQEGRAFRVDVDEEYGYNTLVWAFDNLSPWSAPWATDRLLEYSDLANGVSSADG